MFYLSKISFGAIVALSGLAISPVRAIAFSFSSGESVIYRTEFNDANGWSLPGATIANGQIVGNTAFGTASYLLANPVNVDLGEVFLYWSGIFPIRDPNNPNSTIQNQNTDNYFVGLQYAFNDPVCRVSATSAVLPSPTCPTGSTLVNENAELKVRMRPRNPVNPGDRFHDIYVDPDAVGSNLLTTRTNIPTYTEGVAKDYRLGVKKTGTSSYTATLSFWENSAWIPMTVQSTTNPLALTIQNTDWQDVRRWFTTPAPFESPVTFEAINLQFRKGSTRDSSITSLALTRIPPVSSAQFSAPDPSPAPATVPEPGATIALLSLLGFVPFFRKRRF
jgi:hypothetical protein